MPPAGEGDFLIPPALSSGPGAGSKRRSRHQPQRAKGLLMPLFMALGVFGVSAVAARFLFPRPKVRPQQQLQSRFSTRSAPETAVCATPTKVVMDGADLTSYFSLEAGADAVFGVAEHESLYNGYRFWFQSEENKARFEEDSLKYIPAWGGFCSWGISNEDWWTRDTLGPDADPNQWLITADGRLHFFRSPVPKSKFLGKVPENIIAGNDVWHAWWGEVEPDAYSRGSPLDTNCICSPKTCEDK